MYLCLKFVILSFLIIESDSYNQDCSSYINKNWFGFVFCITQRCPDPNAEFVECGNKCSESCEYRQINGNNNCPGGNHVCLKKCLCKQGYVKESDQFNAPCVLKEKCPRKCTDPNAYYSECGNSCIEVCGAPKPETCSPSCIAGCFCKTGYVKESNAHNARCVPKSSCFNRPPPVSTCPDPNSEYSSCGSECAPVCGKTAPHFCSLRCVEGCFCRPGFVKLTNESDTPCVTNEQCSMVTNQVNSLPNLCLDSNSRYLFWGPLCWPTCDGVTCSKSCKAEPNCYCKEGYVKSSAADSAICIPADRCKNKNFFNGCAGNLRDPHYCGHCSQFCDLRNDITSTHDCFTSNQQMCQCVSSFNRQSADCLFPCTSRQFNTLPSKPSSPKTSVCNCNECNHQYSLTNPICASICRCFAGSETGNDVNHHCNCYDCASRNIQMTPYCINFCRCQSTPNQVAKPGTCPELGPNPGTSRRKDNCKSDSDCEGSTKCCDTWAGYSCLLP